MKPERSKYIGIILSIPWMSYIRNMSIPKREFPINGPGKRYRREFLRVLLYLLYSRHNWNHSLSSIADKSLSDRWMKGKKVAVLDKGIWNEKLCVWCSAHRKWKLMYNSRVESVWYFYWNECNLKLMYVYRYEK